MHRTNARPVTTRFRVLLYEMRICTEAEFGPWNWYYTICSAVVGGSISSPECNALFQLLYCLAECPQDLAARIEHQSGLWQ